MHQRAAFDIAVGKVLSDLRQERNITRDKLAEILEVDELYVPRLETGSDPVSAGGLILLIEFFGITWADFRERVDGHFDAALSEIKH